MNHSNKLNLFLGLGCKQMKDVILHHPDWTIHIENMNIQELEGKYATRFENPDIYIEAIPEALSDYKRNHNILKITGVL